MPLYLTLSRGPRADRATPVLASSDPAVIAAVLQAVGRLAEPDAPGGTGDDLGQAGWRVLRPTQGDGGDRDA
jgi:hypothetical protein